MRTLTSLLFATMLVLGMATSCSGDDTPGPDGTALDPEVVPKQDTDLYPGESADLEFAVSSVFGDDMVVQQNKELRIWGQGTTGTEVRVKASWSSKTITNKVDGRGSWRIRINVPPAPAGNPRQTIVIENSDSKRAFRGVLIGEVWVCSGQSNMQMYVGPDGGLLGVENYPEVIAASDGYPTIRMYTSELRSADTPQWNCTGTGWQVCSSSTSGGFSAVAYFFAKTLTDKLRVPVGLIVNSYGGATAQAYTPVDALSADMELNAKYMYPYTLNPGSYGPTTTPGGLWNAMVYPFLNYSIRGMLWYQGESNWSDTGVYHTLIRTMVREWRKGFGQGDFPHYYVQIAGYYPTTNVSERPYWWDIYSYIRETQGRIRSQVPNSEMVTTLDVSDPDDIHPRKKREIGERLARVALNRDYGMGGTDHLGPRYKSHTISGGTVTVTFDYADGLRTNNGASPKHFYIAGADQKFYLAEAAIEGSEVILTNPAVPEPVAVRYAFISAPITNLENARSLPAEQFRTDNWPSVTYNTDDMVTQPPY